MITCSLTGNFGNNLMCYLMTRLVAEKNGYEYGIDPSPKYDYYGGKSQLELFDLDYGKKISCAYEDLPEEVTKKWTEGYKNIKYSNGDNVDWHEYNPDIWNIKDNTKLYIRCCQDARYFQPYRDIVSKWLTIKTECQNEYKKYFSYESLNLDKNLCVINIRGGEYLGIPNVLLNNNYWKNSIQKMLDYNANMRFLVITDDPVYAKSIFPNYMIRHYEIGMDYWVINNTKNIIMSNSSFPIMSVWLNDKVENIIAPKYWAKHNISTGYWASSDVWTFAKNKHWEFLDREGRFYNYNDIEREKNV